MMTFELLQALVTALAVGLLMLATPALSRGSTYFAVTVPTDFPKSAVGRAILRRYQAVTIASTLLSLALIAPLVLFFGQDAAALVAFLIAALLPIAGALAAFIHCRGVALSYSQDDSGTREVTLQRDSLGDILPRPLWLHVVPYAVLAAAVAWLAWNWSTIPDSVVVSLGGESGVTRSPRSLLTVFGLPVIMTLTAIFCHAIMAQGLIIRRLPGHRGRVLSINRVLLGVVWGVAVLGAYDSLVVLYDESWITGAIGVTVHLVVIAFILLLPIWMLATGQFARPGEPAEGDRSPDDSWKLGLFYFNPDDPALWVEVRFGVGYTVNFARPSAWLLTGGTLCLTAIMMIWAFTRPG